MNQHIIDLYDEYTHAPLDRRVFLARLTRLVGSTAAALALVPILEVNQARVHREPCRPVQQELGRSQAVASERGGPGL
jgi:carboxymethylenebutenolidase